MNKSRKLIAVITMFLIAMALTACGGKKEKEITVDVQKLAEDLNAGTVTSDTLSPAVPEMIPGIYNLSADIIDTAAAYMSAGSTACEAAVFACKEAGQSADVKKALESRVASQSSLYESYAPEQVDLLKKAVIKTAGKYAVLVVCDDTAKAESILKEAGF